MQVRWNAQVYGFSSFLFPVLKKEDEVNEVLKHFVVPGLNIDH
jgi:hypothetical protein